MQKIIEMYMPFRRGVQQFPHQFIAVTPHVTTANYYKKFSSKKNSTSQMSYNIIVQVILY